MSASKLSRAAGLFAVLAGLLFIGIQFIHPADDLANVTTGMWAATGYITFAMALFGLIGVTGIYLRQLEKTGVLGLFGFVAMGLFFLLTMAFTFAETLVLPAVVAEAPVFVESFLGIVDGGGTRANLGALQAMGPVVGVLYTAGGVIFGIALFRARIVHPWAAILLAVGAVTPLLIPLVPDSLGRFAAVPVGLALVGLGHSLWSLRPGATAPQANPVGAEVV